MKVDQIGQVVIRKRDFETMEKALQHASQLLATLIRAGYYIITGYVDEAIYIDYSTGDVVPEFLNPEELEALQDLRTRQEESQETGGLIN